MPEIFVAIKDLGFPIAVAAYLLWWLPRMDKTLGQIRDELHDSGRCPFLPDELKAIIQARREGPKPDAPQAADSGR